jgi:transcription elongation factor GreB
MPKYFTTPAGFQRLQARIEAARASYDAVVATNGDAAEAGDNSVWHDNFAYEENQRQMHQLARRLRDLMHIASEIEVVTPPSTPSRVGLGCAVTLLVHDEGREEQYIIGGYEDGDPALRRVSYTTPLASALMGARVGDVRTIRAGQEEREVEIVAISAAREEMQ